MSSGERFSGYPAQFGYATSQVMDLEMVMGWELDANNTKTAVIPTGAVDPVAYITPRSRPEFRIRTQDIKTVLDVVSVINGRCFDETSTFILQERADCGTFLTGDTHPARQTAKGFMFLESISAEQDSEDGAVMTMRYVPLKTSGNDLVTLDTVDEGAFATLSPTYVQSYFLASPYHNGTEIPGVMSVNLNMNITFAPTPSTPGALDELGSITRREPEFTFTCLKVDEFDAFGFVGTPVDTTFAFYFQKADPANAAGDGRIAEATAEHIKISFTGGDIDVRNIAIDGNEDAAVEVSVKPTGTVAYSGVSAIP